MIKTTTRTNLEKEIAYLESLIAKNGPDPEDYQALDDWHARVMKKYSEEKTALETIRKTFSKIYGDTRSLMGIVYSAPHGYKGDFEIIDRLYQKYISEICSLSKWDGYFQNYIKAPQAVRNRKTYFKEIMNGKITANQPINVLNIASGPCRDLKEFFEMQPNAAVNFDCVELDKNAITYAKALTNNNPRIHFINKNIFRFSTDKQYDLVWSAGLFDYFDDRTFVRILQRILKNVKAGGELIIGNFHPRNPTRSVMELAEWNLHHRTNEELIALAKAAGVADVQRITIDEEPEGINLFMRIKC